MRPACVFCRPVPAFHEKYPAMIKCRSLDHRCRAVLNRGSARIYLTSVDLPAPGLPVIQYMSRDGPCSHFGKLCQSSLSFSRRYGS